MIQDFFERRVRLRPPKVDWRRHLEWRRLRPEAGTLPDRSIDLAPLVIAALLIAGIVHIVSILLMPAVAPRDALARLAEYAAEAGARQGVLLLPATTPGSILLPWQDPAVEEAVCLYDLGKGALRVHADADGEDFMGLSFHASAGRVFHSMTDRSAIKGRIDIVVGDAAQIETLASADDPETPPPDVRLTSPTRRGFVLLRSFAKRESDHARARERLRGVSCDYFELPTE